MGHIGHERDGYDDGENQEPRYNHSNPPPDEASALRALDTLLHSIEGTEAVLAYKNSSDFPSDDQYLSWKGRAMVALGHLRAEANFINWWCSEQKLAKTQPLGPNNFAVNHGAEARENERQMHVRAERLVAEVMQSYQRQYFSATQFTSFVQARMRIVELEDPVHAIAGCFDKIAQEFKGRALTDGGRVRALEPLYNLRTEIKAELALAKSIISSRSSESTLAALTLVLSILNRAVAAGLVLSMEDAHELARCNAQHVHCK